MDPCIEWRGATNHYGYGVGYITIGPNRARYMVRAHRMAWIAEHGPIPDDLLVCHHCDNPPCVNPAHLFLGTHKDNTQDMIRKGRRFRVSLPGEQSGNHKLTDAQVLEIRRRAATEDISRTALAAEYGVTQPLISYIVLGTAWRHLPLTPPLPRGHGRKLTDAQEAEIHQRAADGAARKTLAADFGVSPSLITQILSGTLRRHLLPVA